LVDFKKDTWIYILIAAVLAIISLFTPIISSDGDAYMWWSGAITYYVDPDLWIGLGTATIWTLGMTAFGAALLLWYGIHNMKGMEFKWDWLVYLIVGIVLIIMPILMLVYDFESGMTVGFAPIGILLAGIIAVVAFVLEKFIGRE